jgi:uncharacterized protein
MDERREFAGDIEFRAADKGPGTISGYGLVYESWSQDLGGFREKIARGAAAPALKAGGTVGLRQHNMLVLLGTLHAGTLRLSEDNKGVRYELDLPASPDGENTAESVKRGDLTGSSFSFRLAPAGDSWTRSVADGMQERTLLNIKLMPDIGPVTNPAYLGTTDTGRKLAMRSLGDHLGCDPETLDELTIRSDVKRTEDIGADRLIRINIERARTNRLFQAIN